MAKITLNNIGTGTSFQTAIAPINANNDAIEVAFENTLSRDGTIPNTMSANLDMNSNRILNLPSPTDASQPMRLGDASLLLPNTLGATGTSGHTIPFLDGNNTWSGTNAFVLSNASALTIGLTAGNPAFKVDTTTASSVTGLQLKSAASGGGVAFSVISSASNEALTVDAKGTGTILLNGIATGNVSIGASGRFTVSPGNGFVGIGTAPTGSEALSIVSNGASVNQLRLKDSTGSHTGALASQNNAGNFLFNNQDNANIEFYSNNGSGEQLIIGTSGNGVKVGASSPAPGAQGIGSGGAIFCIEGFSANKSVNGNLPGYVAVNSNTGASAVITNTLNTDAGILSNQAVSTAGGAFGIIQWTGSGGLFIQQKNAAGPLTFRTGATPSDALSIDATQNITILKQLTAASSVATPAGGSTTARLLLGTTAGFGIYYGSGVPTVSAASGSIYIRTDNAGANLRLYSNTTGSTTWAAITSA